MDVSDENNVRGLFGERSSEKHTKVRITVKTLDIARGHLK